VVDPQYPSEVQTPDLNTICSVWHEHAEGETITVTGIHPASLQESAANAAFIVKAVNAYEANQSTIAKLTEALESAKKRMRNCRGAIESNQVVDKDVHGSLGNGIRDIDAALSLAKSETPQ
jgi:hypothetical protein